MEMEESISNVLKRVKDGKMEIYEGVETILKLQTTFGYPLNEIVQSKDSYFVSKGRSFGGAIQIVVNKNNVQTMMPLNDFMQTVRENIGSITFVFSNKQFKVMVDSAVSLAIKDMDNALTPHAGKVKVGV
jgi:hypothetical protein